MHTGAEICGNSVIKGKAFCKELSKPWKHFQCSRYSSHPNPPEKKQNKIATDHSLGTFRASNVQDRANVDKVRNNLGSMDSYDQRSRSGELITTFVVNNMLTCSSVSKKSELYELLTLFNSTLPAQIPIFFKLGTPNLDVYYS